MRIGVNCFTLQENIGGARQYFQALFSELLRRKDHEYIFFHREGNIPELLKLGGGTLPGKSVLLKTLDEVGARIGEMDLYFGPFSALWPRPLPLPSVVFNHDIQEVFHPEFWPPEEHAYREFYNRLSLDYADVVVTNSEYTRGTLIEKCRTPPDRVKVAHLCADPAFESHPSTWRAPSTPLPAEPFIFFPANRWHHKNHRRLLQALRLLRAEYELKPYLVLTGHDMEGGFPVLAEASALGVREQVVPLGYVRPEEVAYVFSKARMLCNPSLFEGFGIPLVEAMHVGCPVTCSCTTSLPEVGGDAALYFEPTDPHSIAMSIRRLWVHAPLREELVAKGKVRCGFFTPKRLADVHLHAFEEAAKRYSNKRYLYLKSLAPRLRPARSLDHAAN